MKDTIPGELSTPGGDGWNPAFLPEVADLNTQFLSLLQEWAKNVAIPPSPLVVALRSQWQSLTATQVQALAGCPYLLVDLGGALSGEILWSQRTEPTAAEDLGWTELVRRVLVFSWHLAHANPFSARILLGLPAAAITAIAAQRLQSLQQLLPVQAAAIRPRWEAKPEIWRKLLQVAIQGPPARFRHLQLWGLQLMASDLLRQADESETRVNH